MANWNRICALVFAAAIGTAVTPAAGEEASGAGCAEGTVRLSDNCAEPRALADQLRGIITQFMKEDDLNATIISVRIGEVEILKEAFGSSMTGIPATTDMHFRNGAVAIAYLSTVLLRLQEQGVLDVGDKLSKWFPEYPRADEITLHMLMNSTAGYADYVNLDVLPLHADPFRQFTPNELIAMGLSRPMVCDPGTCFAYAHTNFVILGEVLSRATGKPVAELIGDLVLAPLALENTKSESTAVIQPPVLHTFTTERGVYEDATYWNPSWTLARGAVMTTDIDDLLTSAIAIGSGKLLSPESHTLQLAPSTAGFPPFNDTVYYAMGVVVTNGWVIQTPSFSGYAAVMAYLPSQEIAVALATTNGQNTPDRPPANALFAELGAVLAPDQAPSMAR